MINESAIFERFGVFANAGEKKEWVTISEMADGVAVEPLYVSVRLKPDQARRLARQLYRLARRVEKRKGTTNGA